MPKGFKNYLPIWLIALVVIMAIANIAPFEKDDLYTIVYYSILISFSAQLVISFLAFKREKEFSYPTFIISIIGVVLLIGANYYAITEVMWRKPWQLTLLNVIVLALQYVVLLLVGISLNNDIERDKNIKDRTDLMLSLTEQVNVLYKNTKNKDIHRLYEALKYADKTSDDNTAEIDAKIKDNISNLHVSTNDEEIKENVNKIIELISDRRIRSKNN